MRRIPVIWDPLLFLRPEFIYASNGMNANDVKSQESLQAYLRNETKRK